MALNTKRKEFNPAEQVEAIIDFIKNYFVENGNPNTKAVIGISGGKDSTIAAALLVRALGADRVIGVKMPNGTQSDIDDAVEVCNLLGIRHFNINIGDAYNHLIADFMNTNLSVNSQIETNTPARLRMTTLYMVAAAVGGRVCNTGNASELFIGYTTKYGDLAGDFALFRNLTVREIYAIGDYLTELPTYLVHKVPADGMSGKTDEDNTGIPYNAIDDYLLNDIIPDMEIYHKMIMAYKRNIHKQIINLPAPQRTTYSLRRYHDDIWYDDGFNF
jgi:NAD+ synthase